MESTTAKRITELDIAKGIGILLVVIGHSIPSENNLHTFIYSFHMPLFFFLSGIVMKNPSEKKAKDYFISERKMIASYIFYSLVFFTFDIFAIVLGLKQIGIKDLFWDIYETVTLYGINVLWFLSTLVLGKTLVKISTKKVRSKKNQLVVSIITFFVFSFISSFIPSAGSGVMRLVYFPVVAIIRAIVLSSFILSGYALKDYMTKFIEKSKVCVCAGCCVIALLLLVFLSKYSGIVDYRDLEVGFVPVSYITGYLGICFVISCSKIINRIPFIANSLVFLGKNSLFIMATHEYLRIRALIEILVGEFVPDLMMDFQILIVVILLLAIEVLMCIYLKPICDRCVSRIAGRIEII